MTITCVIVIAISQIQLPGTIYTSTDAHIETLPLPRTAQLESMGSASC